MEYKTKGKEGTNAKGQKKENKLGKVNKKRGSDGKRPEKEKRDKADDISNSFPNFSVLTKEEKLAFFEALSAARKNIERKGLPTRERFGTVHDEYLEYFTKDDEVCEQGGPAEKKPESAPSVGPSRSPKESKLTTPRSAKEKSPRSPKSVPPPKSPQKNPLHPESEPNDKCEAVIKQDTDKVIQIYLNKKRRIEEQWKKTSPANRSPTAKTEARKTSKPNNKEVSRPQSARAASSTPKPKPPSGAMVTPQFRALNPTERKEFFKILKEAHSNVLERNPTRKNEIRTLDEVLKPYRGDRRRTTTICTATKASQSPKEQTKNLRVRVTLTSGDNNRLGRTKSQTLCDSVKEDSGGRSKSVEGTETADTAHGKQSKIPVLKKAVQESECNDDDQETTTVKKAGHHLEFAPTEAADKSRAESSKITTAEEDTKPATAEEKLSPVKEDAKGRQKKTGAKEKKKTPTKTKDKKAKEACKEGEQSSRDDNHKSFGGLNRRGMKLEKRKAELKKLQNEKDKQQAGSTLKEKELLRKKRRENRKKRHQKKESLVKRTLGRKEAKKSCEAVCDSSEIAVDKKTTVKELEQTQSECPHEAEAVHFDKRVESAELDKIQEEETCREEDQTISQCERSDEEDEAAKQPSEETTSCEESLDQQTSSESQADVPAECQEPAEEDECKCFHSCESAPTAACNEQVIEAATQSKKSLAGLSLLEERPGEVKEMQECVPTFTTGKVILVDDNVIGRIKSLIQYLEKKVKPEDDLGNQYVRLVLSYTEYLTKVTESIVSRSAKEKQQVHSTYTAHDIHLKFKDDNLKEKEKKPRIPRSISENELHLQELPGPSGLEKKNKDKVQRNEFHLDEVSLSGSGSSLNSEDNQQIFAPSSLKKTKIPMTKVRLLQDLLKGRARFVEGSVDDLKIVHNPEPEHEPSEKSSPEETKELIEGDVDHVEKVMKMKFLRALANLCNCGRKQIKEDAILENLKGEAVRVDTTEGKKDPASATINQSTMEVLKAAERKKIIEKYLK